MDWQTSWIRGFDFTNTDAQIEKLFESIVAMKRVSYDLLLGAIFDEIGFNAIDDKFFKVLVLVMLAFPSSKLKTTEYLFRYKQIDWRED